MPVPVSRTGTGTTTPITSVGDLRPAPAGAAPAEVPSQGWAPATSALPIKLTQVVEKAKGSATRLVLDKVADEHALARGASLGSVQGNLKVSEELGLKGSDVFKKLVEPDARRAAFAKANGDAVWVATKAVAGVSAGFPAGAGVSVGLSGGMEVSSIMAHRVDGAGDVAAALKDQGLSMAVPLDADGLRSLDAAPGSEWMFRGTAGASLGAGVGGGQTVGNDVVSGSVTVGASVGLSGSATYTKNVKVLGDDRVWVQIAQSTAEGAGASLGLSAGVTITAANAVSGPAGKLADQLGNKVESATRVGATASGSMGLSQKVLGAAVLDLSTPQGREQYDYILRSSPQSAAAFIESQRLGARYTETNRTLATGLTVQLGSSSVLATSTVRGTTKGTLEESGSTTLLSENTFGRSVGGFLPRLALGEERQVSVRAGTVNRDGKSEQAVAVGLAVKDPSLTGEELAQLGRFASAMGAPLGNLPPTSGDKSLGKGDYALQVAMTTEGVAKLSQWGDDDLRLALASAQKEIEGSASLPPWYGEPQAFQWYRSQLASPSLEPDRKNLVLADYKEKYAGRDLNRDIESANDLDRLVKATLDRRGQPTTEWGPVLEALGKSGSTDVRAAALALHRLAGAEVTLLSVNAAGANYTAKPAAAAPPTMAELVGPTLAPPP